MSFKDKLVVASKRFLRGFTAGFVAVTSIISLGVPQSWTDLYTALNMLILAGLAGGITGGLLALDKYFRIEE